MFYTSPPPPGHQSHPIHPSTSIKDVFFSQKIFSQNWRFGQKEVPGSLRSHSWAVLLPHKVQHISFGQNRYIDDKISSWTLRMQYLYSDDVQEEDQPEAGGRSLFLRQQRHPPHLRHHGLVVSGDFSILFVCLVGFFRC